jgi:predicted dehydrogenase
MILSSVTSPRVAAINVDLPDVGVVDSFAQAIANRAIELVVIATREHLHCAQACTALATGKHVVVDKPFAM